MTTRAKTLRAAVYGRESKDKTKSVDDQVAIGEATVAEQGWTHAGTWRDGSSASRYAKRVRADWAALRAAIDAGAVDVLVLWETSRGSRTLGDWVALLDACRDRGVLIHVVSHERTYNPRKAHDRKTLANDGVDAEHEVGRLSERVCRGIDSAAAAGRFHGATPYGYQRVIVGERRTARGDLRPMREQRPDPDTAPVVVEIITRVAANEPLRRIIRDLNARGVASPRGAAWNYGNVHTIVRNRAYVGERTHRPVSGEPARVHAGTWPALVAASIWQCANAVLDTPGRRAAAPGALRYLLSVIAKTPCGAQVSTKRYAARPRYVCDVDDCTSVDMHDADAWVTEVIIARLSRPDVRELFADDDAATVAAAAELVALNAKLSEARASFRRVDGRGISAESLAEAERELTPLIADAQWRAQPRGVSVALLRMLDAAEMGAEHVRPAWEALSLPAKRELIKTLCASIVVGPVVHRLSRWSSDDDRLAAVQERITIVPRGAHA